MADFETLQLTFDDPVDNVATIVFNRPKALNALNSQVISELEVAVSELEIRKDDLRCVVLTGTGDKAFIAGADIGEMRDMSPAEARNFLYSAQQVLNRLEQLPFPSVAKINGYALGGGLEVALACDIRIASDNAVVGLPEVSLGLIPAAGGTQRLTRTVGEGMAKYMILTAKRMPANEAKQNMIVHEVVTVDELDTKTKEMVEKITGLAPIALAAAKRSIEVAYNERLLPGLEIELNNAVECFQSEDLREGMTAFLEKREPKFKNE